MSENKIITFGSIDPSNLNKDDYAASLIAEALRAGVFSETDMNNIRNDLLSALAEVIGYYTKNESTSLKTDTAQKLSKSMIYNIDTYLLSLGDDMRAIEILRDRRPIELYGKGYLINLAYYKEAVVLFGKARFTRLKNGSEEYNKTLDKYFKNYLTTYDPKFSSNNKIFLSLTEYGLSDAYHIDGAVNVLRRIIDINEGKKADYTLSADPSSL